MVLLAAAALTIVLISSAGSRSPRSHAQALARPAGPGQPSRAGRPGRPANVTVQRASFGQPIPTGFVGLSIEYRTLEDYAGSDPQAVNPAFEQLVRNLAPGQDPSIRIGGDTTDWTWWPIRGMARPLGVRYSLTPRWLGIMQRLTRDLHARVILGINMEVDSRRVAAAEGQAFTGALGRGAIQGLEVGNEPELYGHFAWFELHGRRYYGRSSSYDFGNFMHDFSSIGGAIPHVPLAGPNIGAPEWMVYLGQFLSGQPRVRIATLHRYPLKRCTASTHNTIGELLSDASSRGLADSVAQYASVAHAHHVRLRVDEMNAVSCGGEPGVSNTFASALWSIDALYEMARVGVDGVNIHSRPGSSGELFSFGHSHGAWTAAVNPEYYGLLVFAQSAPAGAHLLRVSGNPGGGLRVWATRAPDGRIRVVLINKSETSPRSIRIAVPAAAGTGTLERLTAPGASSTRGITLGGQGFGAGSTGSLAGTQTLLTVPRTEGRYMVTLPAASAALLTLQAG